MNRSLDGDLLEHLVDFKINSEKYTLDPYLNFIEEKQIIKFYS